MAASEKQLAGVRIAARDSAEAHSKALAGAAQRVGASEASLTEAETKLKNLEVRAGT